MTVYEVMCVGWRDGGLRSLIRHYEGDRAYDTLKRGDSRGSRYGAAKVIIRVGDAAFVHREDAEELMERIKKVGYSPVWIDTRTLPDIPMDGENK